MERDHSKAAGVHSQSNAQAGLRLVADAELERLLAATDDAERNAAWDAFVSRRSRLLIHIARLVMPTHDDAMDAYAQLLERLRRDDCRALRIDTPDGRSQFSTWLAVVARRMCVDFYRQRYGRPRGEGKSASVAFERAVRQRLTSFAPAAVELTDIPDAAGPGPDTDLRATELRCVLARALNELTPDDRLLLKLRFEDDLSAQAITSVLRMPTQFHVYRRLKQVLAELRQRLAAAGVENALP